VVGGESGSGLLDDVQVESVFSHAIFFIGVNCVRSLMNKQDTSFTFQENGVTWQSRLWSFKYVIWEFLEFSGSCKLWYGGWYAFFSSLFRCLNLTNSPGLQFHQSFTCHPVVCHWRSLLAEATVWYSHVTYLAF